MFVSHQLNPSKKKFQKPNILRRKTKVSVQRQNVSHMNTSPQVVNSVQQREPLNKNPFKLHVDDNEKNYIVASNNKGESELFKNYLDSNVNNIIFDNNAQINNGGKLEQNLLNVDSFLNGTTVQQCTKPNFKKGFRSELKLKKHRGTDNDQSKGKTSGITAECPVKKVNEEGVEEQCGRVFLTTEDLLKHLNEDHTPNNGTYRSSMSRCAACGVVSPCGSRGARGAVEQQTGGARTQGQRSRGSLTCSSPGCGRVFRRPYRLREHARAHAADKPYPCHFPNCGWSFLSANNLLHHARRHTVDRRDTCASCGRTFLRRENLRDHCARTHPDSSQTLNSENLEQDPLNVESFLNGTTVQQNALKAVNTKGTLAKKCWYLQLVDDSKGTVMSTNDGSQLSHVDQKLDLSDAVSSTALSSVEPVTPSLSNNVSTTVPLSESVPNDCASPAVKFKCDEPNCRIEFQSELKLQKHEGTDNDHSKGKTSELTAECPFQKVNEKGVEEQCGSVFLTTEDLLKHLNTDHIRDNRTYRCAACGVVSLCASRVAKGAVEQQTGGACTQDRPSRGSLTCSWPGCGRVFRQPCRLREHARSHTGDRPYPCLFPNCGWSFRSASKLLRHARRHTGERRHTCASCGRAFLRREHLRDHCARTHPDSSQTQSHEPHATPMIRVCTYPECGETFKSVTARSVHIRKVHKKPESTSNKNQGELVVVDIKPESENEDTSVTVSETVLAERSITEEMEIDNANEVTEESSGEGSTGDGEEWHAARTHCTWPLTARHRTLYEHTLASAYVLEDDVPVEQSESSESNIYTIRSDLFLHGNVLINEDSEFVVSREYLSRSSSTVLEGAEAVETRDHSGTSHALDAELDLIDAHPTIDLMQDELMYADTAVDESSFRVFFT